MIEKLKKCQIRIFILNFVFRSEKYNFNPNYKEIGRNIPKMFDFSTSFKIIDRNKYESNVMDKVI
jgi:hypothetical protein